MASEGLTRRVLALRLTVLVALAGILPIAGLGAMSVDLLRRRSERAAQDALQVVAEQAGARIQNYITQQQDLVRSLASVAGGPDAEARLEESVLDLPSLGRVVLLQANTPASKRPPALTPEQLQLALSGKEVASNIYLAPDTTPAMDFCCPARFIPGSSVCASLDVLELWRFVQKIRIGATGYALTFDATGRLLASGLGSLRAAILTEEQVLESPFAVAAVKNPGHLPDSYRGPVGVPVLAGWAVLPKLGWSVVVEQSLSEVRRSAKAAQWMLGGVLIFALLLSLGVGIFQSHKMLEDLEIEERWRTAGRIAAGITHDLGHRLRVLEQTAALAESGQPAFMDRIRDNLRSELDTLRKFVADFSDLARGSGNVERLPLELGAFLESVCRTAAPYAASADIQLTADKVPSPLWVAADRHLLQRAVLNLLSNAVEASGRGDSVEIAARAEDDACLIEVRDHGEGIAPERLPRLFDEFKSTKRTGAHLGMGLPNVKRIVEAHAGQVSVTSAVGQGTTFRIRLPRAAAPGELAS